MNRPTILKSLHDLAENRAKAICSDVYPHFSSFVDAYERIILDELVEEEIIRINSMNVAPLLRKFAEENEVLPFLYTIDGKPIKRIRSKSSLFSWFEISYGDEEEWRNLSNKEVISLYHALDEEGLLPFNE